MPRKKLIPDEIREQVITIVDQFNEENALPSQPGSIHQLLQKLNLAAPIPKEPGQLAGAYVPRFRGAYLYLARIDYNGRPSPICRLKWSGHMDKWEFAIYKYSTESYDPEEWFFPGAEEVDGTVTGAMRAGNEAYPL